MFSTLCAGAGLSSSSGLNAYLPLVVLALADRMSSRIDIDGPFDWISSGVGILVLLLVLPLELIADKIPKVDHLNDLLHTPIRPLLGAVSFMAYASVDDHLNIWVAGILGFLVAGATHVWKMRARPLVTAGSKGLGNPFVSMLEDGLAIVVSIMALVVPFSAIALIPVGWWVLRRSYARMAGGKSRIIKPFLPGSAA